MGHTNRLGQVDGLHSRRQFICQSIAGIGAVAATTLFGRNPLSNPGAAARVTPGLVSGRAKRVIQISLLGGPSQIDLFDYKPRLREHFRDDLGDWLARQPDFSACGRRHKFFVAPSIFRFSQHGQSGMWLSELLPYHGKMADDLCLVRSMQTDAGHHDAASLLLHTGTPCGGGASSGACVSRGLGAIDQDTPAFVVLRAQSSIPASVAQTFSPRLWGADALDCEHGGKSQTSTFADVSAELPAASVLYGSRAAVRGTFAHAALAARRLVERGVRFVQILHPGWDHHENLPRDLAIQARDIDQACYGLVQDLKQRGLLQDTVVVCSGEFGRTVYGQASLTAANYGRDHHPHCFAAWMAGAGVKAGHVHGETDEFSFGVVRDPVHVNDLRATLFHLTGVAPCEPNGGPMTAQSHSRRPARLVREILA